MSAPLSLVRLRPDLPALARWGIGRGYLSRHGEADFGYVLHVALRDGLGRLAPRPFVLRASRGANEAGELLGYVRATPETMKEATALPPVNGSASALDLAAMEVRAMRVVEDGRRQRREPRGTRSMRQPGRLIVSATPPARCLPGMRCIEGGWLRVWSLAART